MLVSYLFSFSPPLTTRVVVMRVAWGYWKTSPSFQGVIEELLCLPCYSYSRQCRLYESS